MATNCSCGMRAPPPCPIGIRRPSSTHQVDVLSSSNNSSSGQVRSFRCRCRPRPNLEAETTASVTLRRFRRSYHLGSYGQTLPTVSSPSSVVAATNRRHSSGHSQGVSPLATIMTLGEFVRPRKLDLVLQAFPPETPLVKFCGLSPNSVSIEDEALREKVMVAIHAARAYEVSFCRCTYVQIVSSREWWWTFVALLNIFLVYDGEGYFMVLHIIFSSKVVACHRVQNPRQTFSHEIE